ncbi:MAG: CoA transferase [Betaproteobacteria bacterium]|nr:CoA transferase [Betaproteobacteria bacterium]
MQQLPLAGLRVIEFGQIIAGPAVGLVLGDLGADVIQVEHPDAGSPRRPGSLRDGAFFLFNRNKRSVVVDLTRPEGHALAVRLLRDADVLVENMAPGTIDRLGLGYERLREENPRLIYCSIKGFLSGPNQTRLLTDHAAQMISGLAYMTGPPGTPLRAGASVVDIGAAAFAVVGILAALLQRNHTGEGQRVSAGIFETALLYVGQHIAGTQLSGKAPKPFSTKGAVAENFIFPIYDLFACRDGKQVFIGTAGETQWQRLCAVLDLKELADDLRLQDNVSRIREREWLVPYVADVVAQWESGVLLGALVRAGVIAVPVHTPGSLLEDPQLTGRLLPARMGMVEGDLPALPYESSEYEFSVRQSASPDPGKHTRGVLLEFGLTPEEVESLARKGVVRGPDLPAVS